MLMRDILLGKRKYLLDDLIIIVTPSINRGRHRHLEHRRRHRQIRISSDFRRNASGHQPEPGRRQAGIYRGQRPLRDGLQSLGPRADLRRPRHQRLVRVRHRLHHIDRTRRPPRTPRLRLGHAFPGGPGDHTKELRLGGFHPLRPDTDVRRCLLQFLGRLSTHGLQPGKCLWTTEAKFVAAAYGLRNRMSILAETGSRAGNPNYEKRVLSTTLWSAKSWTTPPSTERRWSRSAGKRTRR